MVACRMSRISHQPCHAHLANDEDAVAGRHEAASINEDQISCMALSLDDFEWYVFRTCWLREILLDYQLGVRVVRLEVSNSDLVLREAQQDGLSQFFTSGLNRRVPDVQCGLSFGQALPRS